MLAPKAQAHEFGPSQVLMASRAMEADVAPDGLRFGERLRYGRGSAAGLRTEAVSSDLVRDPAVLAVSGGRPVLVHAAPTGSSVLLRTRGRGGRWRASELWASYDWTDFAVTAHRGRATAFVGAAESNVVLPVSRSNDAERSVTIEQQQFDPALDEVSDNLVILDELEETQAADAAAAAEATYTSARMLILVVIALALVAAVTIGLLVARSVSRPLAAVVTALGKVRDGDLTVRVPVHSRDEVGVLAATLNASTASVGAMVRASAESADALAAASEQLTASATSIAAAAEQTSAQATVVSAASEQVAGNAQTVATGAEDLPVSIREIAQNATEAAHVAGEAVTTAETTSTDGGEARRPPAPRSATS